MTRTPIVVGGGLAGPEAARVLSAAGLGAVLHEMRPQACTPAHRTADLGEIVCSNSLGGTGLATSKGVLIEELRRLGSLVVEAALATRVPAGESLAVDRSAFAQRVTSRVQALPLVRVVRGEVTELPEGPAILATGPLTSEALARALRTATGDEHLYFYDAVAPIVSAESLDHGTIYAASRYGRGAPDFLNCPLSRERYEAFVDALRSAEVVSPQPFEEPRYFESCLPIEVLAERGKETLAFGPMRPVGLPDPRTGRPPFAVVQLRREDRDGQLYNLVGFQTRMRHSEQKRVLRTIPGLERAEFVRLGSIHRNTYVNAPALLAPDLSLRTRPDLWLAGLLVGVEGYLECAALGLLAGLAVVARVRGAAFEPPPRTTLLGGLLAYLREADPARFQPMNVTFGLLPPLPTACRGRRERRVRLAERAAADLDAWIARSGLDWLAPVPAPAAG